MTRFEQPVWVAPEVNSGRVPSELAAQIVVTIDPSSHGASRWSALTRSQYAVAHLLCLGKTRGEIAELLGISEKTYDTHRLRALESIGVSNEVGLVMSAVAAGVIAVVQYG